MYEELGCTKDIFAELLKHVSLKTIYNFLNMHPNKSNVLRLMFYVDEFGTFIGRKRPFDYIAKTIFDHLDKDGKKQIFKYLEYIEEGK